MTAIKICGITRRGDAEAAVSYGAQALGFVLWPSSPRHARLDEVRGIVGDLPPFITTVGVFVAPSLGDLSAAADCGLRLAQVHGAVPDGRLPLPVLRAVHLSSTLTDGIEPDVADATVLLDALDPVRHGGTGRTVDWSRARAVSARRRIILAGGLTPANVREAILTVRPYGVDVASGVETAPGVKDHDLLRRFIDAAKETE